MAFLQERICYLGGSKFFPVSLPSQSHEKKWKKYPSQSTVLFNFIPFRASNYAFGKNIMILTGNRTLWHYSVKTERSLLSEQSLLYLIIYTLFGPSPSATNYILVEYALYYKEIFFQSRTRCPWIILNFFLYKGANIIQIKKIIINCRKKKKSAEKWFGTITW